MIPLVLTLVACVAEPAPETVEELAIYGFVHFEDAERVAAVVDPLIDFVEANPEEVAEGYALDALTEQDLVRAGVEDVDVDGILGAMGSAVYTSSLPEVADVVSSPDKDVIYDNTVSFEVLWEEGDRGCFLSGACATYAFTAADQTKVPLLGKSTREITTRFRWIGDDQQALVMRQLVPDKTTFSSGLMVVDQQYGFIVFRTKPEGGVQRVEAMWIDARIIGLDVPEGLAVDLAVGQMQKAAQEVDEWFSTRR